MGNSTTAPPRSAFHPTPGGLRSAVTIDEPAMSEIRPFEQIDPGDTDAVGGKGLSLGLMTRAGLPVPPGFCITSAAHRRLRGQQPHNDDTLARAIVDAYHQLGGCPVAVRSSP